MKYLTPDIPSPPTTAPQQRRPAAAHTAHRVTEIPPHNKKGFGPVGRRTDQPNRFGLQCRATQARPPKESLGSGVSPKMHVDAGRFSKHTPTTEL